MTLARSLSSAIVGIPPPATRSRDGTIKHGASGTFRFDPERYTNRKNATRLRIFGTESLESDFFYPGGGIVREGLFKAAITEEVRAGNSLFCNCKWTESTTYLL